ncbi:AraC family transcriptional regulator ligand-binding domain-containing protein [Pseudomonas putida]
MPTLSASCAEVFLRLVTYIPNPSSALEALHREITQKVSAGERLPLAQLASFIDIIHKDSGDSDVSLHSYEIFRPALLDTHFYAVMSSATLGEALKVAAQFSVLLSDKTPLVITDEAGGVAVNFIGLKSLGVSRQYIDSSMSTLMGLAHWLQPWEKPTPSEVYFTYEMPQDCSHLHALFGENLSFSQVANKICFSQKDSSVELATANPILKLYHLSHANEELAKHRYRLTPSVRNNIYIALTLGGEVTLERMASELHLGARTLQHRLEDEGTGFREIFDDCRRELAAELLRTPNSTMAEIAERLDFRDSSSFHKACNRWFGCPPGSYRTTLLAGGK